MTSKKIKLLGILVLFLAVSFVSGKFTKAYLTDTEKVLGNSIQAGVWGETPTPTPLPGEPTSTPTPVPVIEEPTPTSTPTLVSDHLVINEVFYDVDSTHGSEGGNEWVEVYNPTYDPVDISGWRICDNTSCETIPATAPILSFGFAIITPQSTTWPFWSIPSGATKIALGTSSIGSGLANDDDRVILKKADDTEVDKMSYGTDISAFDPSCPDVSQGHSLERNPDGKDTDTAADFVNIIDPTPGN